ncbi:MAG: hypothetical protein ABIB65_02700, partial [Candidatus Margulisiibacteriota bacterium]
MSGANIGPVKQAQTPPARPAAPATPQAPARPSAPSAPAAGSFKPVDATLENGLKYYFLGVHGIDLAKVNLPKEVADLSDGLDRDELRAIGEHLTKAGVEFKHNKRLAMLIARNMDVDGYADGNMDKELVEFVETINWYAKGHHVSFEQALEIYAASGKFKMVDENVHTTTVSMLRDGDFKDFMAKDPAQYTLSAITACLKNDQVKAVITEYIAKKFGIVDDAKTLSKQQVEEVLDILACLPDINELEADIKAEYFGVKTRIEHKYEGERTAENTIKWLHGEKVEKKAAEKAGAKDASTFIEKQNELEKAQASGDKAGEITAICELLTLLRTTKPTGLTKPWDVAYQLTLTQVLSKKDEYLKIASDGTKEKLADELTAALSEPKLLADPQNTIMANKGLIAIQTVVEIKKFKGESATAIQSYIDTQAFPILSSSVWSGNEGEKARFALTIAEAKAGLFVTANENGNKMTEGLDISKEVAIMKENWQAKISVDNGEILFKRIIDDQIGDLAIKRKFTPKEISRVYIAAELVKENALADEGVQRLSSVAYNNAFAATTADNDLGRISAPKASGKPARKARRPNAKEAPAPSAPKESGGAAKMID